MTKTHTVLAGRYAPLGNTHLARVRDIVAGGGSVTLLATGADASRSSRAPWTTAERLDMCRETLAEFGDRVTFAAGDDHPYDPEAARNTMIAAMDQAMKGLPPSRLVSGLDLEGASILYVVADDLAGEEEAARTAFFNGDDTALKLSVPVAVFEALRRSRQEAWFAAMAEEHRYIADYRKSWQAAPYPPIFVTVDMLIEHRQRVLLIQRGGQPGRGLWALPGGFLDSDETLKDAALRELREETGLRPELYGDRIVWKGSHVFDDPQRSARGRTITHAYHVEITGEDTPMVEAADDAAAAKWVPIANLPTLRNQFFEDHGHILSYFLNA